ncbi:hypothetical protein EPIR_3813 [Erwinia piriflorinigrans CFBP 5888]|uniref:Uncharacterized protein n=1 Tax=Erwinia piriflorinigrans CFBP 5888 TaxID=1161919 RepID=V5ZDJ8_9GAMM|nr:hypothetical protein EPIR_3813 [Erwinia piriflorinigrans CFBP 5888]
MIVSNALIVIGKKRLSTEIVDPNRRSNKEISK